MRRNRGRRFRGNGGIEPYGFANAPVHPGSHKYNDQQKNNDPTAGGGNVRIHADRVTLAGTIDVTTEAVRTSGAPSGGQAANEPDEPLEVCRGTFRYLVGPKTQSGLVIVVR